MLLLLCDSVSVDADCGDNDSVHLRRDDIGIGKVVDGKIARSVCNILGYAKKGRLSDIPFVSKVDAIKVNVTFSSHGALPYSKA